MKLHGYITPGDYRRKLRLVVPSSKLIDQITPLAQAILELYRGEMPLDSVSVAHALVCAQAASNGRFTRAVTPLSLRRFMDVDGTNVTAISRTDLVELVEAVLEGVPDPWTRHSITMTFAIVEAYLNRKVTM